MSIVTLSKVYFIASLKALHVWYISTENQTFTCWESFTKVLPFYMLELHGLSICQCKRLPHVDVSKSIF